MIADWLREPQTAALIFLALGFFLGRTDQAKDDRGALELTRRRAEDLERENAQLREELEISRDVDALILPDPDAGAEWTR